MGKQLELPPQFDDNEPGAAAVGRYYSDQGKRLEALRLSVANLTKHGIFAHAINIRFPVKAGDSHLVVVKALHENGPLISFASGYNLSDALFALGGRLRSGGIEWKLDSFPHDDWEKHLAYASNNRHLIE